MSNRPDVRDRTGPASLQRPLVLTGGGTGGHLYPALSIAAAVAQRGEARCASFEAQASGIEPTPRSSHLAPRPVFIGTRNGIEATVVPQHGFEYHAVVSRKVQRRLALDTAVSLVAIAWGTVQAAILLRRLRPLAVIGTGGYASTGVVLAAALQGIPTLIHEQNAVPGRSNRLLGRIVRRVALTFPNTGSWFPGGKSVVTGLPVRPDVSQGDRARGLATFGLASDRPTLLVLGGSLGARSLNRAIRDSLPNWQNSGLQIVHQVGRGNWEEHRAALPNPPAWYRPVSYLEEMGDAYAVADLVLCRAGASTLAELTLLGLPAILVPYPYAHADHQTANARSLVSAGAAQLLPDAELSGPRLVDAVGSLLAQPEQRQAMATASRALGRPNAAYAVLDEVWRMVGLPDDAAVRHEVPARRGVA